MEVEIQNIYPIVFVHFSKSTVNGIVSGVDSLLMPHLKQYYDGINKYCKDLGISELFISSSQNELPPVKNENLITKLKFLLNKFTL
jgi:hypothetical protein